MHNFFFSGVKKRIIAYDWILTVRFGKNQLKFLLDSGVMRKKSKAFIFHQQSLPV